MTPLQIKLLILAKLFNVSLEMFLNPIDLTWSFDNSTIYWPGSKEFEFTKVIADSTTKNYWYAMNEFCAAEHGGTHIDAPYHFYEEGHKVGDIPIEKLITKGVLIDISEKVSKEGPTRNLEESDITDWEKLNGQIENNTVVLVKFGWSQYYTEKNTYLGINDDGKLSFPGISTSAANWLAKSQKIVGVGLDVPSVDPGSSENFDTHRILAYANKYNLENVKILEILPVRFTLLVMPMNIKEGTGAPVRIIAVENA